jgi:alpha-L-fucosidase
MKRLFLAGLAIITLLHPGTGIQTRFPLASSPAKQVAADRLQWWREARFGMFIHWGPVSLKGTEIGWSRGDQVPVEVYDQLYRQFNPVKFKAEEWVAVAKEAGMKYIMLTSKHHDGFCLWSTQTTSYNIMNTPFHRDVVKELSAACKKEGIIFCTYFSILDWHHPDYPLGSPGGKTKKPSPNMPRYVQYLKTQLGELARHYGPLGIFWFDGEWEEPWTSEMGLDLYRYCRSLQDSVIVNNRVAKARKGMEGVSASGEFAGDYDTPEQRIGSFQQNPPWESCITICQQWSWKPEDKLKSLQECLRTLATCAGGDGNLLLNVGPMPDGRIEPRQVKRLKEIGAWLKQSGSGIYGTRGGPYQPGAWGASTWKENKIYLHLFEVLPSGLELPSLPRRILSSKSISGGNAKVLQTPTSVQVHLDPVLKSGSVTVLELTLDGEAGTIPPVSVAGQKK